jgi:hypothetical protein
MTGEERERARSECDKIVFDGTSDQPSWRLYLKSRSDQGRKEVLRVLLSPQAFERWCILRDAPSYETTD